MSKVADLTIEGIIRKYENRQERLISDISRERSDEIDTARNSDEQLHLAKSGLSTPEFSNTVNRKEINRNLEEIYEKTHKKQDYNRTTLHNDMANMSFKHSLTHDRGDYDQLLLKLDQTEEKLVKSERNYAEIWRKHEKLLQEKQHNGREVELEQRLRHHEVNELEAKTIALERENKNYKECISSKDSNIEILREKLKEKNQRLIESDKVVGQLRSQLTKLKAQRDRINEEEDYREKGKEDLITRLKTQLKNLQDLTAQKDSEKKDLLLQLQKNYKSHQQELQILKQSYLKVEQEYKQWIEQCNSQKLTLIKEYQLKLNQARISIHDSNSIVKVQTSYEQQFNRKDKEVNRLIGITVKQANEGKLLRSQLDRLERDKSELILSLSSVENKLIDRIELHKNLEVSYSNLQQQSRSQEEKLKEMREKYNAVNRQFLELRSKCNVVFQSMEESKRGSSIDSSELIKVRKELVACREQIERGKNNQFSLNQKLNDAIESMKDRILRLENEKEESMTDLLAERLENARLKEEIKETKEYLRKEYELSIENTRKELENQIGLAENRKNRFNSASKGVDPEKEELYLQLRALERKYELLMTEIVTVDEVMNLASKVQRRHKVTRR